MAEPQARYLDNFVFNIDDTGKINLLSNAPSSNPRAWIYVYNLGPNIVYIGGPNLTAANGYPLPPQDLTVGTDPSREVEAFGGQVYAICATGETAEVRVMTQRF